MGPVSSDDLKQLAAAGELTADDLIWKEGLDDWKPAGQLKGLLPEAPADEPSPAGSATVAGEHQPLWQVPLMVAALVLISSMFVPWWSFRIKGTSKDLEENVSPPAFPGIGRRAVKTEFNGRGFKQQRNAPERDKEKDARKKRFGEKAVGSLGWYFRHFTRISVKPSIPDDSTDPVDIKGRIWGWNLGPGMGAALFGFLLIPLTCTMMFSRTARRFSWITSFLAAYVSLAVTAFAIAWYLDSPGFDFSPIFHQGASFGPYLVLGGGVLVLVFGLLDGILGLRAFRRSQ
jgi:hypothetical protein